MRLIPSLNRVEYLDTQKQPVAHLWDEEFLDRIGAVQGLQRHQVH